ncbi:MAG TPA: 50S ribosomal protein L6 [Phycisphaerae bacterium]|nr:50S ribosomal protein L6 [Phycisphaerae bacterium]
MSRIGKKPIAVPGGVSVEVTGQEVRVSGPKCQQPLTWQVPAGVAAKLEDDGRRVVVTRADDQKRSRALHGLSRALIANMVHGAAQGYERRLLVYGTGYGCNMQGGTLRLNVGFMGRGSKDKPQFVVPIPEGIEVEVEVPAARGDSDPAKFVIRGADKQLVGEFAAEVRGIRPPEPYKGKGIRYEGERVIRKAGKAFAGGGA